MAADERTILHVDMDAFFVSVELLRRPELRGKPVVVGGTGSRGVVAAASYEARHYGVYSAMPATRARRLCPQAVFLPGDHSHYGEVSARVMAIFRDCTPLVEPISLDEAFLDVTGSRRLLGSGATIAASIRQRVLDEEGLTCAVGVAPSKMIAKMASEAAKPSASAHGPVPGLGVKVVAAGEELDFLHPLPVRALWGVGPKTYERLASLGVRTIGDLAALTEQQAAGAVGEANGRHLWRLAHAVDDRPVVSEQRPKSVGHEETFAVDHRSLEVLGREVVRMGDAVADRLRRHGLAGRTVTLKIRFHDFRTITRQVTVPAPIDTGPAIVRAAKGLLEAIDPSSGVRLLGVSVSGLGEGEGEQLALFGGASAANAATSGADGDGSGNPSSVDRSGGPSDGAKQADEADWVGATRAIDDIRRRYGTAAIGPAVIVTSDGLKPKRQGDQQWGPDEVPPKR